MDDLLAELDDPRLQKVVRQAWRLISQPSHLSVHPGGIVATPGPTTDRASAMDAQRFCRCPNRPQ